MSEIAVNDKIAVEIFDILKNHQFNCSELDSLFTESKQLYLMNKIGIKSKDDLIGKTTDGHEVKIILGRLYDKF